MRCVVGDPRRPPPAVTGARGETAAGVAAGVRRPLEGPAIPMLHRPTLRALALGTATVVATGGTALGVSAWTGSPSAPSASTLAPLQQSREAAVRDQARDEDAAVRAAARHRAAAAAAAAAERAAAERAAA